MTSLWQHFAFFKKSRCFGINQKEFVDKAKKERNFKTDRNGKTEISILILKTMFKKICISKIFKTFTFLSLETNISHISCLCIPLSHQNLCIPLYSLSTPQQQPFRSTGKHGEKSETVQMKNTVSVLSFMH